MGVDPNSLIRVLIVDDHALIRNGMSRILSLYKDIHIVGAVGAGEEAVQFVNEQSGEVEVILMDIDMPGMGGINATRTIRQNWPRCEVILLTGFMSYSDAGFRAGARGYILKTSGEDEIAFAIRRVYEGHTYIQQEAQDHLVDTLQQDLVHLSERERDILVEMCRGRADAEIGQLLGMSGETVRQYIQSIRQKLGARDRAHAVAIAFRQGLIR